MEKKRLIKIMDALIQLDIYLFDSCGDIISFGEIMYELQGKWKSLSEDKKDFFTNELSELED